jgi:hypothetical protein
MTRKVCITTVEYPPDAESVGNSVDRIAHTLIDQGYEVYVAVFRSKQRFVANNTQQWAGCKVGLHDALYVDQVKPREPAPGIHDFFSDVYFAKA